MNVAVVAAARELDAFPAYFSLVSPALRDLARGPLRRARHKGRPCSGVDGSRWCDECEQTVDDHVLDGYARLRKALAGAPPRTRTGDPVREMESIARWLTSPEAAVSSLDHIARVLRRRPNDNEPAGVRAARAQLVHHVLRSLEARVRREDAVSRGASAQPERDLRKSDWAQPLRVDKLAFELLVDAIIRLRNGASELYDIPADRLGHLDLPTARRLLRDVLNRLRELRSGFYMANMAIHLEPLSCSSRTLEESPEDLLLLREETELARRTLSRVLAGERTAGGPARYRWILARICSAELTSDPDLVACAAREFAISSTAADRFVRRLVHLACRADLDWVARQADGRSTSPTSETNDTD